MSISNAWRTGIVAAAIVAWPLLVGAQSSQQSGSSAQQSGTTTGQSQQQQQQPPQQQPPQSQQGQPATQGGFGQEQGQAGNTRQIALSHLTAARQALADLTRLPAASKLQGDQRNEINELISNFNALITSSGPEWRQAYDKVQQNIASLVGPQPGTPDPNGQGSAAVGTTGATSSSIDPSIAQKLGDVRQHINEFGEVVGVKPGQSAEQSAGGAAATAQNEAALRNIDQIGVIVTRALSQQPAGQNSDTVTISRQELQQIQQYLNQLRQSVGGGGQGPVR